MNLRPTPPPIPPAEFAARQQRAREDATVRGLDALLVWSVGGTSLQSFGDLFYLSNHYPPESRSQDVAQMFSGFGHAALIVPVADDPVLLVNKPDYRTDLVAVDDVRDDTFLNELVLATVRDLGLERARIGVVREDWLPLPVYRMLTREHPGLELVSASDVLERRRSVKSPAEIEQMRYASDVGVEIMNAMLAEAVEGGNDGELAIAGYRTATRLAATPWDFAMASGPHSAHAWWSRLPAFDVRRPYERGDIVHPDVYGAVDGYFYDFVRSIVVGGSPTAAQRELLEMAIAVAQRTCATLVPGAVTGELYADGLAWIAEQGWTLDPGRPEQPGVVPLGFLAHGIGLGWEEPYLKRDNDVVLHAGMTLAVEVFVTGHGIGAAYEETVLVTDALPEIMTARCPTEWW